MAENRRGRDNRRYFSRGQMVLLGAAFTVASLVIFVLGVFVGQEIESRKLMKKEEPLVKIPVTPPVPESSAARPSNETEITFNAALPKPGSALASVGNKGKSGSANPVETVARPERQTQKTAPEKAPAKTSEKKLAEVPKKPPTPPAPEAKESAQGWRAQVNAFPDERSAKTIVDRLKEKGYNAYVTEVQSHGKTWYRVNVGKYGSREEANKMVEVLRTKENFPKAFAATR